MSTEGALPGEGGTGEAPYPSLDVIRAEFDLRLTEQDRRSSAFDGRAGIVIGFAGALIGLSAPATNWVNLLAMVLAVVAAFLAAWAMWPRVAGAIQPRVLRDKYLMGGPEQSKLALLDTRIVLFEADQERLEEKGTRVKLAASVLAGAILMAGVGAMVDFFDDNEDSGGGSHEHGTCHHHWTDAPPGPAHGPRSGSHGQC